MKIGYRTIKTAVGTALSIFIAQQAGLSFFASAGIITILCVQVTRKKSVAAAIDRLLASLLGLLLGGLFYEVLGYHPFTIGLLLLLFIPLSVRLKVNEGFVTSAVLLLHIYSLQRFDLAIVANELGLLLIGTGVALLMNLYMPSREKELRWLQREVEKNFSVILKEFSDYLRNGNSDWSGKEMLETVELLEQAIQLSVQDVENRLIKQKDSYYQYFTMREKQFELLERMLPIISSLHLQVPQGAQIADFLDELSNAVHPGNTAYLFLDKLAEMRKALQRTSLPTTREEFEIRASLFYLLREIERYLHIKDDLGRGRETAERSKEKRKRETS